jgi:hypothetical protein
VIGLNFALNRRLPEEEPNEFDQNRDVARCHFFDHRSIEFLGLAQFQVIGSLISELFESGLHGNRQRSDRRQTSELAAYVGTLRQPVEIDLPDRILSSKDLDAHLYGFRGKTAIHIHTTAQLRLPAS